MPITLGLNVSSLRSQRLLSQSSDDLSRVFTRLSSGQRINKASDDAAGLAIADGLNADARVFSQGVRNLNDGVSVLNVADGALQELTNITIRLTELSEQAANGVLGDSQRASLNEEAQALSDEYFRITQSTEFNGRKLFSADYGELRLQGGYGLEASIGQGLGGAIGNGSFGNTGSFSVGAANRDLLSTDINGDGVDDIVSLAAGDGVVSALVSNGQGGFNEAFTLFETGGPPAYSLAGADFNGDGVIDFSYVNNSDDQVYVTLSGGASSYSTSVSYDPVIGINGEESVMQVGDFNGDGKTDLLTFESSTLSTLLGNGDGTFREAITSYTGLSPSLAISVGDVNGDGITDVATADYLGASATVLLGSASGTFSISDTISVGTFPNGITIEDFNNDGFKDIATIDGGTNTVSIAIAIGDGTFNAATSYALSGVNSARIISGDYNGDGNADIVAGRYGNYPLQILIGSGDGTFADAAATGADEIGMAFIDGDFNGDGVLDIATNIQTGARVAVHYGLTADGVAPLLEFSLESVLEAKQALSKFSRKLDQLSEQRGEIGAFLSRIGVADTVLGVSVENFRAAESRIRDADIAEESANLTRLRILQQAGAAVLTQSNIQPELALQLLSI